MYMVAPRTGAPEITIAESQTEYKPLVGAVYRNADDHPDLPGAVFVLTRWRFTLAECERLAAGDDLYIAHMTFGGAFQPLSPQVGADGYEAGGGDSQ